MMNPTRERSIARLSAKCPPAPKIRNTCPPRSYHVFRWNEMGMMGASPCARGTRRAWPQNCGTREGGSHGENSAATRGGSRGLDCDRCGALDLGVQCALGRDGTAAAEHAGVDRAPAVVGWAVRGLPGARGIRVVWVWLRDCLVVSGAGDRGDGDPAQHRGTRPRGAREDRSCGCGGAEPQAREGAVEGRPHSEPHRARAAATVAHLRASAEGPQAGADAPAQPDAGARAFGARAEGGLGELRAVAAPTGDAGTGRAVHRASCWRRARWRRRPRCGCGRRCASWRGTPSTSRWCTG